jgi:gluconate 2-dehydrogenase gamma chain
MANESLFDGTLDRRALMARAILLVGGVVSSLPELAFASAPTKSFFTPPERAVLDAVCAGLIPRTDTPGALEVGVPAFIDAMMINWAKPATAGALGGVLKKIDDAARAAAGRGFASLPADQRAALLQAHDAAAFAAKDKVWRRFKTLALTAYYLSEPGATQELRYELSPGIWEPAVKMGPDTRAWAGW